MKNNKIEAIGDILIVRVVSQITGKIRFMSFEDELLNITSSRYVDREYRISVDGTFWTNWRELTNLSLATAGYYKTDGTLIIEVRYHRNGTDDTGTIDFMNIKFEGNHIPDETIAPTLESSIFADIANSTELKQLETNIFKKLYYRGILPQYITRAKNSSLDEDRDFADLWSSVARFFGLFIRFFKRYEAFRDDYDLLYEYLRQYGIYFNEQTATLEELQYLAQHFYDQIRQRGTAMIFKRKGEVLPDGTVVPIDGELVRLLRSRNFDELLYELIPLNKIGWCIGESSPLWRGTSGAVLLNKTRENTKDFQTLDDFVTSEKGNVSLEIETVEDRKCLGITINNGTAGLGRIDESTDVSDKVYVVDSRMDYEITFAFRIQEAEFPATLEFGVEGFGYSKNKFADSFITPDGSEISERFFYLNLLNCVPGVWYYARGIIHAYSTVNVDNVKTNLGIGNNLYFNNSFVKYILPKILLSSNGEDATSKIDIWDYKIRPLVRGTNILPLKGDSKSNSMSLGFIQSSRIFHVYARNNNNSLSQDEVEDIINKYLLSFNMANIFTFINTQTSDTKAGGRTYTDGGGREVIETVPTHLELTRENSFRQKLLIVTTHPWEIT